MMPSIALASNSAVRLAALQAALPKAFPLAASNASVDILLMDAVNDSFTSLPETNAEITIILAPARPSDLPPSTIWIATPCSPTTLQHHLGRAWQERNRTLAGHTLHLQPPGWHSSDGTTVVLSDKEAQLLAALMDAPNGIARERLLEILWGMDAASVETHALETQLYRLRQKLQPHWGDGWFLGLREGICVLEVSIS